MGARLTVLRSPRRLAVLAVAAVVAGLVVWGGIALGSNDGGDRPMQGASNGLPTRTIEAGAVTVKLEPQQLDAAGARFKVSFDTHSFALDLDVASSAALTVGTNSWPVAGWTGDGPGGHHREGELRFDPAGPLTGAVTLRLDGLPEPVSVSWEVGTSR